MDGGGRWNAAESSNAGNDRIRQPKAAAQKSQNPNAFLRASPSHPPHCIATAQRPPTVTHHTLDSSHPHTTTARPQEGATLVCQGLGVLCSGRVWCRPMSRGYIMKHDLHIVLETLVGEALKERPDDPLVFIATKLMAMRDVPPMMGELLKDVVKEKVTSDDDCRKFIQRHVGSEGSSLNGSMNNAGRATSTDHLALSDNSLSPTSPGAQGPAPRTGPGRKMIISARACSVCGRDDRPGDQRKSGFKCFECVGIPSNPQYKKEIEEAQKLLKGRDEEGQFALNEYRIITTIGQGSYGKVRLCVHNKSNQNYAIKFLSKDKLSKKIMSGNPNADGKEGIKKIREEIAIMKQLQHPNIIQIYGTMESDTEIMIVMEHLEGQIYPSTYPAQPLPLRRLKRYIVGIAHGLQFLHDKLIIHRDIKPDNILLDKKDNVKLADFGVSAFAAEGEVGLMVEGFAGSPFFMPPEYFGNTEGSVEGPGGDVWSFGITLYAMAMGNLPPFKGSNLNDLGESIVSTEIEFNHESELLNDMMRRMLQKDPQKRATIDRILHHDLLMDVRIVKGHPVETVELSLKYNEERGSIDEIGPDSNGDMEGADILCNFMESSKQHFQIIQGNPYEVTLYDLARDPRRQKRHVNPGAPIPSVTSQTKIVEEDWDSDDVDDEGF
eukprot:TRINITY_DN12828_c0_g3_i2.p1 TRINITY_DN12828_c0_g3~~TRINITY_DN12828_c0_g3_i2.p1  ORF type:complete len:663 (+),score=262.09 TRINITY_DN12828_c0_g3_i2:105-2093(+)